MVRSAFEAASGRLFIALCSRLPRVNTHILLPGASASKILSIHESISELVDACFPYHDLK